jgi:hypothetical protein
MDPTAFATAYALSTSIGLRPFLTLAIASLAMHFGYLHPSHAFAFLGTDGATALLAALAIAEFAGDKIPLIDHTLHVLHIATKPIAAAVIVGSTLPNLGPGDAVTYALMATGAANALAIHTGVAALRGASTLTTAGLANPIISLIEDVTSIAATLIAFLAPFAAAVGAIFLTLLIIVIARSLTASRSRRATQIQAAPR